MKSSLILAAGGALLLSACHPMKNAAPALTPQPQTATAQANKTYGQYTAQPGRSVSGAQSSVTDAAFEQHAAAYTNQATAPIAAPQVTAPQTYTPQPYAAPQPVYALDPMTGQPVLVQQPQQQLYSVDPVTGQLVPVQAPAAQGISAAQQQPGMATVTGVGTAPSTPAAPAPAVGGSANYAVQMINGTSGRLFVEVFDDSDNVFPIGYMFAGANLSTPPSEARPIQGQLTVVVRDPDKPNAPELRRYKVDPPANYGNKTIGITILPGGRYRASLDGQVYYTSPDPKAAAPATTPAPAATPAPAPAAAPAPAPAPAPTPAAADPATAPTNIL